jgi:NAD(P)-dependent dehydrogenase (short-subunit alcohol dehydrogenase family)
MRSAPARSKQKVWKGCWEAARSNGHTRELISSDVPLGRIGRAEEIANAVVFLASDDARFVIASEFFVDGGFAQV